MIAPRSRPVAASSASTSFSNLSNSNKQRWSQQSLAMNSKGKIQKEYYSVIKCILNILFSNGDVFPYALQPPMENLRIYCLTPADRNARSK
jgi:hypothetical protein